VRAFHREINLQSRGDAALHQVKKGELAEVARKLNGLIDAIADGLRAPGLQQRPDDLEARRKQLEQELAAAPTTPVRLHYGLSTAG
jgi:site-specific DNA recombinase